MLQRIRRAYQAGRRAVDDRDSAASGAAGRNAGQRRALLVLDLPDAEIRTLADRHVAAAASAGTGALLITSATAADLFLRSDLVCEHLPLAADLGLASDDPAEMSQLYLRRRLQLVLDKWAVAECLWAGDAASDLLGPGSSFPESNIRFLEFI